VGVCPAALLVVLVYQLVVFTLTISLCLDQFRLVDPPVHEFLFRQVLLEDRILFLHIQAVE
jgi:hypothetical protein